MLTLGPLNGLSAIRHAFFTRAGGVSGGLYATLNCGLGSGDDKDNVRENRRRAMVSVDLPADRLVTAFQTHSNAVAVVDEPWPEDDRRRVDAMVTDKPHVALGILTADCAPVLLADPKARVVGAAHAGWRGALDGVLENTLEAMESLGARRRDIMAGVGPCIGRRSYEVGPEFPDPFLEQDQANGDFFCPAPREGHFLFDLRGYVSRRLASMNLDDVQSLPCDTCAEEDRFFSYRRSRLKGQSDYGRELSVIYLEG
ncbi:MAG: peptidoglycan editing factor PgeF [Rhodovibrionaceae bacterium]|nr:peptidoglycan editing factor PgeF [Rhodovibrionaceae bacterium]